MGWPHVCPFCDVAAPIAVFPHLKAIVVSGHSAGGQYVTRYEMANQIHDTLGVPITYVVSNPSSYAYLDPERPVGGDDVGANGDKANL